MKRISQLLKVVTLLLIAGFCLAQPTNAYRKQQGVCWVGGREMVTEKEIANLRAHNVTWISQTPFGWQRDARLPELRMNQGEHIWWGESDDGLKETTRLAREQNIRTVLKPHIWVSKSWPGEIQMQTEADWVTWFGNYEKFILNYAQLAQESKMDMFCIGTELQKTIHREKDWRKLIQKIKSVYTGPLVYAANFHEEFQQVKFWDALDYIGVQAYFPLSQNDSPAVTDLVKGWAHHLNEVKLVASKFDKPVLFTEVGYRSTLDAAREPWRWPAASDQPNASEEAQAVCYEAFFQSAWKEKWLAGAYFWKWYPHGKGRLHAVDFTPQDKKAQQVLKNWFTNEKRY